MKTKADGSEEAVMVGLVSSWDIMKTRLDSALSALDMQPVLGTQDWESEKRETGDIGLCLERGVWKE